MSRILVSLIGIFISLAIVVQSFSVVIFESANNDKSEQQAEVRLGLDQARATPVNQIYLGFHSFLLEEAIYPNKFEKKFDIENLPFTSFDKTLQVLFGRTIIPNAP